jgi:hypothetical protein
MIFIPCLIQPHLHISRRRKVHMAYTKLSMLSLALCLVVASAFAQGPGDIQGTWQLVSQKFDGKTNAPAHMIKTITKGRWSWIRQDKEQMLAQFARNTHVDSLEAMAYNLSAGYGTYTLAGDTYTETVEYASFPSLIGQSIPFKVKIESNRLYQSGKMSFTDEAGKPQEVLLEEEYQRLD